MGTTPRFGTHFLSLALRPDPSLRPVTRTPVPSLSPYSPTGIGGLSHDASCGDIRPITPISAYRATGVAGAGSGRRELWN